MSSAEVLRGSLLERGIRFFTYPMALRSDSVIRLALRVCDVATVGFTSGSLEKQKMIQCWRKKARYRGARHSPLACSSLMGLAMALTVFRNPSDEKVCYLLEEDVCRRLII